MRIATLAIRALPMIAQLILLLGIATPSAGAQGESQPVRPSGVREIADSLKRAHALGFAALKVGLPLAGPLQGVTVRFCHSGRAHALVGRRMPYNIDAVITGSIEVHEDTAVVLSALDSLTVCVVSVVYLSDLPDATAFVTLVDSTVSHAMIGWSRRDEPPPFADLVRNMHEDWGTARRDGERMRTWSRRGVRLVATGNWFYGPGPGLTLTDGRACRILERIIHRRLARKGGRAEPGECWPLGD